MRLLLLSENPVLVDALEAELAQRLPALRVIGKCYSVGEGMKAASLLLPDIVILDCAATSLQASDIAQFREHCPCVVILEQEGDACPHGQVAGPSFIGKATALFAFLKSILL